MTSEESPIQQLCNRFASGEANPLSVAQNALQHANRNAGQNVYLSLDRDWTTAEADRLPMRFPEAARPPLYGLPISLKDCFALEGFPTTCGSRFYAESNGIAAVDSWVAERLRNQGAVLTGKTHLHQLAYGITGENSEYGDCVQPRNQAWLTGGSSSGAAASVQEGSAIAAIGTDTGGSVRAPAALCGLAGYRSSLGLGHWEGAAHLAPSFDTIGWLFQDLRDAPLLANALLDVPVVPHASHQQLRIGSVDHAFLDDCDQQVIDAFTGFKATLCALDIEVSDFDTSPWNSSFKLFSAIQASEASVIHAGNFARFEPPIAERLAWGASISPDELQLLRRQHEDFRSAFDRLFESFDFLILPCAPVSALLAGANHSSTRKRILRFTSPASLAGTPVVAVPLDGAGVQVIGRHGEDAKLVAFAAWLGSR